MEVRVWQEDESPSKIIAGVFAERGMHSGRVGIEETLPFTYYDHFRAAAAGYRNCFRRPRDHSLPRTENRRMKWN